MLELQQKLADSDNQAIELIYRLLLVPLRQIGTLSNGGGQ